MTSEDKPIRKLTLKECKSLVRKLKRRNNQMEEEINYIESAIYINEMNIEQLKNRIKKINSQNQ